MSRIVTLLLLLLTAPTIHAQQAVFSDFEVSQPAEPQGGLPALQRFMAVNIRKPFMAQVANIKGTVIVQGVVEPDGHIADVAIARSLRPDCDREALRAFALFNAWKPAQKDGKSVRQRVTLPVRFGETEAVQYENGMAIRYFNEALEIVAPHQAVHRSVTLTDTLGFPTGDMIFLKRDGQQWQPEVTMSFFRADRPASTSSAQVHIFLGHLDPQSKPFGIDYVLDHKNTIRQETFNGPERTKNLVIHRSASGLVIQKDVFRQGESEQEQWYANGQIRQIMIFPKYEPLSPRPSPERILAYWDSTGTQTVRDGNGTVEGFWVNRLISEEEFMNIHTGHAKGACKDGLKQGTWQGRSVDGKQYYEERYDKGMLLDGKAWQMGRSDTLHYSEVLRQPEFKGGLPELGNFLGQNLNYPMSARRSGDQGRVFVSFVVCEDGSLCDYAIIKSVSKALDNEALRVVKKMSKQWKPGIIRGQPVRVKYNLPVNFTLD